MSCAIIRNCAFLWNRSMNYLAQVTWLAAYDYVKLVYRYPETGASFMQVFPCTVLCAHCQFVWHLVAPTTAAFCCLEAALKDRWVPRWVPFVSTARAADWAPLGSVVSVLPGSCLSGSAARSSTACPILFWRACWCGSAAPKAASATGTVQ